MSRLKETAAAFLPLGLTSFGGPAAHLGYFHSAFVERRGWIGEKTYADLASISQFLPGPASSKVSMAIGYHRAGWAGLAAAWFFFTIPSAIALTVAGLIFRTGDTSAGWIAGLLAAAIAVVLHAITGMAGKLLKTVWAWVIAAAVLAMLLWTPVPQIVVIGVVGVVGAFLLRGRLGESGDGADDAELRPVSKGVAYSCLIAFFVLLFGLWAGAELVGGWLLTRLNAFYQAGALVFGGGHVVLPLLESHFVGPGWVSSEVFISGYSLAQAVPGPLFTFASYLGAADAGIWGAVLGTVVIFVPGTLLMVAGMYFWSTWRTNARMRAAFAAINAAVVGLLTAALIDPIIVHGITGWRSLLIAVVCWVAIALLKAPAWAVAAGAAAAGWVLL